MNPYQIGSQESKTLIRVHVELHRAGALCEQSIISSIKSRGISIGNFAAFYDPGALLNYEVFNFSFIAYNAMCLPGRKKIIEGKTRARARADRYIDTSGLQREAPLTRIKSFI